MANGIHPEDYFPDHVGRNPGELEDVTRRLQGKLLFHPGKGKLYRITGVIFDAEHDRWMMTYREAVVGSNRVRGPEFAHLPESFKIGERFMEVRE